jgi:hypothetical protein
MHNGWTNYATWRINLEIFDNIDSDNWAEDIDNLSKYEFGQWLKEYVEQLLDSKNDLAESYALAFINDVNWSEIAEHIIDTYKENYCCDNCNERIDERYMKSFCSEKCEKEYWLLADHPKG